MTGYSYRGAEELEFASAHDPIDQRLRAIVLNNKFVGVTKAGWEGFAQMVDNLFCAEHAKALAAEKLLALRNLRRFHTLFNGKEYWSEERFREAQQFRKTAQDRLRHNSRRNDHGE